MRLWGRSRGEEEQLAKTHYEFAIKKVYGSHSITLAIAHMRYFRGFNYWGASSQRLMPSPDNFAMYGVVHEYGFHDRRIFCEVKFSDQEPLEDGSIGSCSLTHLTEDEKQPLEAQHRRAHMAVAPAGLAELPAGREAIMARRLTRASAAALLKGRNGPGRPRKDGSPARPRLAEARSAIVDELAAPAAEKVPGCVPRAAAGSKEDR